ncbi:GDYXXLXY domain-containing protein [Marinobacterium jannaschii]|uniref:GDYXXLXY domain-containing protein n=1 Tax=Marinobacterium jannaschii TaxID=64970 RepID=UPI000A029481|nr:GDYXXLXY domain-containing protein [Marinobacterium jannaschii]
MKTDHCAGSVAGRRFTLSPVLTGAILAAILIQLLVLSGMLVKANWPLYTGTEVKVRTVPVDPRSLFRGNYARLNYAFSRLTKEQLALSEQQLAGLREGEIVYLTLVPSASGLYQAGAAYLKPPGEGIYLRGRLQNRQPPYRVLYGIEAWFAPRQDALALEKELRDGGVAVLMVTDGGRGALKAVAGE